MLPPNLQKIKNEIESKFSSQRTQDEENLLEELRAIDRSSEIHKAMIDEGINQITSGPDSNCPCCGR